MTSAAGGVEPAPAMKPRAPLSKLPNAAQPNKGEVSAKKNKVADGSGSSKPSRKKLAGEGKKRSERGEQDGKESRCRDRGEEVGGRGEEGGGRGEEGGIGGEEGGHKGVI
ncbi:hypothetical protein D1007_40911 [Hordeum vulgare]|nr:hypothetical protein D1007_40911 [Hordeum vulgare]